MPGDQTPLSMEGFDELGLLTSSQSWVDWEEMKLIKEIRRMM